MSGRWTQRMALLGVCVVSLGPIAACSDDGPEEGEASFEVEGEASIVRQDGEQEEVDDDTDVRVGDELTILSGDGRLELDDGTILELREGINGADSTVLVMGPVPVLEAGDVLVLTDGEIELTVAESSVTVDDGAAKLSRDAGLGIAAYTGMVHLDSAGQARDIPALREMQVPALGSPPDAPRPLEADDNDPWDRRLLGAAMDLGDRLDAVAAGFSQNLPRGQGRTVGFFQDVLPGLEDEPELTSDLMDRDRRPGETLIGAAIADLGRRGSFAERWRSTFAFRAEGASWGLVALDQGVDGGPLLDAVEGAVANAPLALGPQPEPRRTTTSSEAPPATSPPASAPPTTARPSSPTTTAPPATLPPDEPGPLEPILGPVLDPVAELLSTLLGGLLGGLFNAG